MSHSLNKFVNEEFIDDYTCDKCKEKRKHIKIVLKALNKEKKKAGLRRNLLFVWIGKHELP